MKIKKVFYTLIGIFILLMGFLFVPMSHSLRRTIFPYFALLAFVFCFLGIYLVILTFKSRIRGKLKWFLIFTGGSSSGILISVLLHNLVYGLFIVLFGKDYWDRTGLGDEPFFFILAVIILPILFLVGVIGSMIMFKKESKRR